MGEAKLIAVGHTNGFAKGIGGVSTLMHHYGRDSVPLGSYKGAWAQNATAGRACRVGLDAPHCHTCAPGHEGEPQCDGGASADHYLSDLISHYPSGVKSSAEVPTAVEVYRKALAAADNHSVAIASIGITTNMRDLVLSDPDEHSSLWAFSAMSSCMSLRSEELLTDHDCLERRYGPELIAQKVKVIVWMDGGYNFGCAGHDYDDWLGSDAACRGSAKLAVEGWPSSVKQIFSGVGGDVMHGDWLANCSTDANPCRRAQQDWPNGPQRPKDNILGKGRSSWDPITVLTAVRGPAAMHLKETCVGGTNTVDVAGREQMVGADGSPCCGSTGVACTGGSNQSHVEYEGAESAEQLHLELNELLCRGPLHPPQSSPK
jgi:hypothetical protein